MDIKNPLFLRLEKSKNRHSRLTSVKYDSFEELLVCNWLCWFCNSSKSASKLLNELLVVCVATSEQFSNAAFCDLTCELNSNWLCIDDNRSKDVFTTCSDSSSLIYHEVLYKSSRLESACGILKYNLFLY